MFARIPVLVTLLGLMFGPMPGLLPAQVDPKEAHRKEIEAQIRRMRELLRQGKLLRSHVRVTVRLKNGNKIQGVVKDGRLIEKVDGLHFVLAEAKARGAGIRVWYYDDTVSYIFLPFEEIQTYKVHERLTTNQIQAIERKIAEDERKKDELRKLQQGQPAQPPQPGQPPGGEPGQQPPAPPGGTPGQGPGSGTGPTGQPLTEEEQHLKSLLEEFPPDEGWSEERRRQIEMRKVTVGAFPTGKDKRFLEVFDEWKRAFDLFGESAGKSGSGKTPPK